MIFSNYKEHTLPNGLKVIFVPNNSTEVVTTMILFGVGSRYEKNEQAGISHLLEHMVYKGTKKRPTSFEIAEFIDSFGGDHNAFTSKEYTGFYVKATPKHLPDVFDFLSDLLLNSKFSADDLEKEKKVISEEIKMFEDLPMAMVENYFEAAVFGNNELGREIIGSHKTVGSVTQTELIEYCQKYYYAQNTVIVLAGNLGQKSPEELQKEIENQFCFPENESKQLDTIEFPNIFQSKIVKKKTEQSHLVIGFRTVPLNHVDFYKLEVLSVILGGSMSSRMFEEIREKRSLAYAVKTSDASYKESGALYTQAGIPNEKVEEAALAIVNEYKKIKTERVTEKELNNAKEILINKMLIKFEDSEELAYHYASSKLLLRRVETPDEMIANYRKVSATDIMETANKYFEKTRMAMSFIGPSFPEEIIKQISL